MRNHVFFLSNTHEYDETFQKVESERDICILQPKEPAVPSENNFPAEHLNLIEPQSIILLSATKMAMDLK